ncbi:MAG: TonB-dependent receptor [Bacteroidetes bacterium]|nr:MAG: TonB-dependent receptor [Bacteroidota bacterium]
MKRNRHFFKPLWVCLLLMMAGNFAFGQVTVTGTVTDGEDKSPLFGVNVVIKDAETVTGTITDFDGKFSLEVPDESTVLVFSYTGYDNQEVTVGSQRVFDIALASSLTALDEVVVVGYTTRKRGELTGSVSTVNNEDIARTSNRDLTKSLAGKVPGLIISDRGGYPGATGDVTLLIRGKSTLNNNAPLVLVDGVPSEAFSHLSPQDIESISVLKDGAAAIYGARAANGVILITTKRGRTGKPVINLSSNYSISSFSNTPNLMSSEQYAIYRNEAAERAGIAIPFTQDDIDKYAAGNDPLNYPSTNWAEETFATSSPEWRNTLSVSGGSDKVNYFISGDHIDQVGLFKSGDLTFKQYQVRSNVDVKLHETFTLGLDLAGRFGNTNEPGVDDGFIYKHIYTNEPTEVATYPNGLIAWGGENGANPIIMSSNESGFVNQLSNNLRSKIGFDWKLDWLTEGLSINSYAGIRKWTTDTKSWYTPWTVYSYQEGTDEYIPQAGFSQQGATNILRETFWKYDELMLNATIRYNRTFGQHSFKGLLGMERFNSTQRSFWAERRDFPSNDRPELFAGSDEGQISYGGSAEWARLNYFGSLSYDFQKKYFLDLTLRHDGSGNFGPGNRFGTFPGVAVAWSIGNEAFMESLKGTLDALKLRASWAIMGNDRISPFQYLTRYNYGGVTNAAQPNWYIFGTPGVRYNGYVSATVPNPDITWETADMRNIGLNFAMFDYKLTGDINYFYQKREGILITRNASIPDAAGITLPQENLGKVDNFGLEAQLEWTSSVGEVNYNIGANFTQAKNQIVYMDEAEDVSEYLQREGYPMDSYIVYPTDGLFADEADVEATDVKLPDTGPGDPKYIDTNGDGVIDAGDRTRVYASNVPEIQYGVYGGVSYKGFDVNFLFQGQAKAQMIIFFDQSGALPEFVFTERWTPENPDARYPRARVQGDPYSGNLNTAENFQAADTYLFDASFLRLKEVELGYTLPKEKVKFGTVRVFARGLNLLTMFSEVYDLGLDPEAARYDNFRNSTYPSLKAYQFGLNLTFN